MQVPYWLLAGFVPFWLALAIRPKDRGVWLMENSFTVATIAVLALTHGRWPLSDASYILTTVFFIFHTIGGHYRYGHVPYVRWTRLVLGEGVARRINTKRNHFDRFVHLGFGLFIGYPALELLERYAHVSGAWAQILAVSLILAASALFELIEWAAALVMAREQGIEYLGAQGDQWDAQADMALAGGGSIVALVVTAVLR